MFGIKKFLLGLKIVPKTTSTADAKGEFEVIDGTGKAQYHNGASVSPIVTEAHTAALTNKTIVVASNTITTAATGNLVATELNAALAELDLDIGDVFSDLGVHITDTIDAHDASAISNIPAGSIASTDVQAAINELDGDVVAAAGAASAAQADATQALSDAADAQADIDNHISDATDAHDASAISNVAAGNLAATDVQAALNELQGDINTINGSLSGFVTGPASATDEAIARFDATTGKLVQNSVVTITDAGVAAGLTGLTSSGTVTASGTLTATGSINEAFSSDAATTGANATITSPTTPVVRLTNASLTSVDQLASPVAGRVVTIVNATGNAVNINNNTGGTAANRILTGTKGTLSLADEASIVVKYDSTESRWMVIGGTGAGGGASLDTVFQLTGGDVPLWSTGDNATFLGGGTMVDGTFVADTTTPLQGLASYKYTQGASSLNEYAASPAQTVDVRFRGQETTLFFPYTYDGANNDIEMIFYDVTNSAIIPSSAFIQASTNVSIFKTNIVIPSTCASIRVGFQTKVLNSGKIFEFDSVQLSSDTTVYATQPVGQSSYLTNTTSTLNGNVLGALTRSSGTGVYSYNSGTGVYTVTKACRLSISTVARTTANTSTRSLIYINGSFEAITTSVAVTASNTTASWVGNLAVGETFYAYVDTTSSNYNVVAVTATAESTNILTAPDTFSTDTAPLVYAGSATYTLATLANAPVGTFITSTYAINTNTRTQTTTAPTQTTSDMNTNGILLYSRAYNAASTAAQPAMIAIQIGKGLKGMKSTVYKSSAKTTFGDLSYWQVSTTGAYGTFINDYNEITGIMLIDLGFNDSSAYTARSIYFSDYSTQGSGYVVINASKNSALTGLNINAVAARGVNTAGTSIANSGEVAIVYDAAKTYDTHGALNNATGIFTAPETAYYKVSGTLWFTSSTYAIGNVAYAILYKNGTAYAYGPPTGADRAAAYNLAAVINTGVYLVKNETIQLRALNNRTAGATTLEATAGYNHFSIHKTNVG